MKNVVNGIQFCSFIEIAPQSASLLAGEMCTKAASKVKISKLCNDAQKWAQQSIQHMSEQSRWTTVTVWVSFLIHLIIFCTSL